MCRGDELYQVKNRHQKGGLCHLTTCVQYNKLNAYQSKVNRLTARKKERGLRKRRGDSGAAKVVVVVVVGGGGGNGRG